MKMKTMNLFKHNFAKIFLAITLITVCFIPTYIYAEPNSTENTNDSVDASNIKTIVFFGDDGGVGLETAAGNDSTKTWYCERGKGITWLKSQFADAKALNNKNDIAIVVAAGFSECSNILKAKDYTNFLNSKVDEFNKNTTVPFYYVGLTPVDETKYGTALNSKIEAWNDFMQKNLDTRIVYIDAYSLVNNDLKTKNDGYHLTEDGYRAIYENVVHTIGLKTAEEIAQDALNEANAKKEVIAVNGWGIDKQGEPVFYDGDQNIVTGWHEIEGGKYYFDQYGHYLKGLQEIEGKTYFFNTIGLMSRGPVEVEKGKYSLFGEEGYRLDKWQEYGGDRYYINNDGFCLSGWWTIGTRTYYFKEDGAVAVGLTRVDGYVYYFDVDGGVRVGWQIIDDNKYYFEDGGKMAIGKYELDGYNYYFFEDGGIAIGWNTENDGVRYYTEDGIMVTGFQRIDGEGYFFAEGGLMKTGWYNFSGGKRYFDPTGKMAKGLYNGSEGTYYFNEETGYMETGLVTIEGEQTYFCDDGKLGQGWQKIDGKKYFLNKDGHITTNLANADGNIYFFNQSGAVVFSFPIWVFVIFILMLIGGGTAFYINKHPDLKLKLSEMIKSLSTNRLNIEDKEKKDKDNISDLYDSDEDIIEDDE